ncbi:MAG TPA: thioredoxin domain-containing protein [Bryobacteraceae bacterium]|nr:thioredoxin domain-containing protein [Bryobacteraceae bacterium]
MRYALIAALCLCLGSLGGQVKPQGGIDTPALEAYVRHLLAIMPEVTIKIDDPKPSMVSDLQQIDVHLSYMGRTQDEVFFVTKDGQKLVRGYLYDLKKNPFQADLEKLKTDLSPSFGAAGAPVVIVIFSDFECPNCKEEAKILRENLPINFAKEVRLYFKDKPLVEIHPWAKAAAIAGRCVFRQDPAAFWRYHDWMYEHQGEINADNLKAKVLDFVKTAPDLDGMQLGRCIDTKATEAEVDASMEQAKALHVDATPTIFINGRRLVGNYPWVNLEQIINGELNYQKTAQNAGEKCCEVSIPSPLKK